MEKDYSEGRYRVTNEDGAQIGIIDFDEYVRNAAGTLMYRLDGDKVYHPGTPRGGLELLATIENDVALTSQGAVLFRIEDE